MLLSQLLWGQLTVHFDKNWTAENNLKPNRDKDPLTWLDQTVALVTFGNVIRKDFFCKAQGGG